VASEPTPGLHPAQNRALRECYAFARQLVAHWSRLAERLEPGAARAALEAGAGAGRELLDELADLTADYGLYGFPAAQNVGSRLAGVRNAVGDRTLERNQALRMAVLDAQHLTTLLAYLAGLGEVRGDERMSAFCNRWERRLKRHESAARRAAVALGHEPDEAIVPVDPGLGGRLGHGLANKVGTFGEWFDRRAAQRRGDRAG
jgi:hypothetical protein